MHFNTDSIIFIIFLIINFLFGIFSSRGIKNLKEYAVGNGDFSTATIVATIVATWASGSFFFNIVTETYKNGLYYIWAGFGGIVSLLTVALLYAPRMKEFLGKLSVAEAMGDLYGNKVRIVTAIAGFIGTAGYIGVQLKVAGALFEYCFEINAAYGVTVAAFIITSYSALGGIRSVTFTDIIQLLTFGTIIPTIAFFILKEANNLETVVFTLNTNKIFNYQEVFDFTRPTSLYYLFFFIYAAIPSLSPPVFQRIAMAKDVKQAQKSFFISAIMCFGLSSIVIWIGILTLSSNPNLNPKDVPRYILFNYSYVGLKGLTLAGVMAMVMSTVDSFINSSAVLFTHDFCKTLKLRIANNELNASRAASVLIGIIATILALTGENLLKIVVTAYSFYMPVVTVPFMLTILGFRSSGKAVLSGMTAGLSLVLIWNILGIKIIDPIIPGMIFNLIVLKISHYLFNQKGGWIIIQQDEAEYKNTSERKFKRQKILNSILNFKLVNFFKKNTPDNESIYIYVGLFCMITTYATMHILPKDVQSYYAKLSEFILFSSFFLATVLFSYPVWLKNWRHNFVITGITWNFVIFYVLICNSFAFVVISEFSQVQIMIFMINLIVIASLLRWWWALIMLVVGILLTIKLLQVYTGLKEVVVSKYFLQAQLTYLLLLISSILIIFVRPKQKYYELTEEKNEHLRSRIETQEEQLHKALEIKEEFLRNIQHEYHTPMTGVVSLSQILLTEYKKMPLERIGYYLESIYKSAVRIDSYDSNINMLSKLSKTDYELNLESVNLSNLLYERILICRKLYEQNGEDREFILNVEENITANIDKEYFIKLLDNLVINAINYCKKGKIKIVLKNANKNIDLSIEDEGIGIPASDIDSIFGNFTVGSRTRTSAGGRGIGLSLCKRIVEIHGGRINAESNGIKGAIFKIILHN